MRAAFFVTVLAFAFIAVGITEANAQDIDCRNPPTAAEVTMCRNPELLNLNDRLSRHYFRVKSELRGRDLYEFEREQANWREARRRCIYDVGCIHSVYRRRIDELRDYRADQRGYRPDPRAYRQRY